MISPINRLYFENAAGRVEEDTDGYVRLVYYPNPRQSLVWQGLLQHTKHLLTRQGLGLMLIDQRRMPPFSSADQNWLVEQWIPQAILEGGYRYGAIIQAEDAFARLSMETVRTQARNSPLTYRYFQDEQSAVAWLLAQ